MFKDASDETKETKNEVNDLPDEIVDDDGADQLPEEVSLQSDGKKDAENANCPEENQDVAENKKYYDDNGKLYRTGTELEPNCQYELNGYIYQTDEMGRIISAEGKLHLKDREGRLTIRDSLEDIGKGDQKEGDDRGHLIGDQFDGSNGLENMVPQDADINQKDFRKFENELASEVKSGKDVYCKIEPVYDGDSRRPSAIVVTYSVNGEESVRIFPNGKEG